MSSIEELLSKQIWHLGQTKKCPVYGSVQKCEGGGGEGDIEMHHHTLVYYIQPQTVGHSSPNYYLALKSFIGLY